MPILLQGVPSVRGSAVAVADGILADRAEQLDMVVEQPPIVVNPGSQADGTHCKVGTYQNYSRDWMKGM